MARHEELYAGPDGWSPWRWPVHQGYRMSCCGCGLVHEVEIVVHKAIRQSADGMHFRVYDKPVRNHRIRWRFKVNHRATGQVRRHMKETA